MHNWIKLSFKEWLNISLNDLQKSAEKSKNKKIIKLYIKTKKQAKQYLRNSPLLKKEITVCSVCWRINPVSNVPAALLTANAAAVKGTNKLFGDPCG